MPAATTRGNKRGRAEAFPEKDENPDRIAHKMHHMAKEVKRSAKKAKTFETQKLVKKLKALKKDGTTSGDDQLAQLEGQLEALKNMDHESIGLWALRSKLKKGKVLSQDPAVTQAISSELEVALMPDESETITLVRNRLLSSKTLASDVSSAATALRALLQPQGETADAAAAEPETAITREDAPKRKKTKVVKEAPTIGDDDEDDVQHPADEQIMEIASEEEVDDDGWESGSVAGSDSESDSSTTGRKGKVAASSGPTTSSTFLPSLSVGYVRGDSDSDYSDEEKEDAVEPKKNRRGQRARRAIWEKKFGKNANHVVKGLVAVPPPSGKHASGGQHIPGGSQPRHNGGAAGRPRPAPPAFGSGAARPAFRQPQAAAVPEVLHPSWEAKRKLKEKQSTAIVPAQGKKITFT